MFNKIGITTVLIILLFGSFCAFDLARNLNIKNQIIGYFYTEPEIVQINDFEYDIKSLLFTNTGTENQYYSTQNAKPVSNFDKTKKYTVTINGIEATRVSGDYNYIDANFTNEFISTLNETILIDTLNIKINFYQEGTKIVFITNGGEQAVSLWSSYIEKNGFKLNIVETNYSSSMQADNLPIKTIEFYFDNELYQSKEYTILNYSNIEFPTIIKGFSIKEWRDENGNVYNSINQFTPDGLKLYAVYDLSQLSLALNSNTLLTASVVDAPVITTVYRLDFEFKPINNEYHKLFFNQLMELEDNTSKLVVKLNDTLEEDGYYNYYGTYENGAMIYNGTSETNDARFIIDSSINTLYFHSDFYTFDGYGTEHFEGFYYTLEISYANDSFNFKLHYIYINDSKGVAPYENYTLLDYVSHSKIDSGFMRDATNNIFSENLTLDIVVVE